MILNNLQGKVFCGSKEVTQIYQGNNPLWPPPPPSTGIDPFDIDMLVLLNMGARYEASYTPIWEQYLTEGVTHDISRQNVTRPTTTASSAWQDFDDLLLPPNGNSEFGILVTSPNLNHGRATVPAPDTTINKIKEFVEKGGTLFILSDNMNVQRAADWRIESLIGELGGIKSIPAYNPPVPQNSFQPVGLTAKRTQDWMFQPSSGTRNYATTSEAIALGIMNSGVSITGRATGGIQEAKSNGISLVGDGVIHMWDNKTKSGSLASNVNGRIVWFGDWNFNTLAGVMQPLLTYIASSDSSGSSGSSSSAGGTGAGITFTSENHPQGFRFRMADFTISNGGDGYSVNDILNIPLRSSKTINYNNDDDVDTTPTLPLFTQGFIQPTFKVTSVSNGSIVNGHILEKGDFSYFGDVEDADRTRTDSFGTGFDFSEMATSRSKPEFYQF